MVNGIETFRDYFAEYTDQYVIIGGFACDLLMEDAGLDFRQTKDIDMVIIIEALTEKFAARFWNYIKAGGYKPYVGSHGESEFYRFVEPTGSDYPFMIELFSRPQNNVRLRPDTHLMPLHIDDTISSLSAILLNEDYYKFLLSGRTEVDHIPVLNAEHIVPFKMKAWLDLRRQKENGVHVNLRDLRKHRLDVFRLYPIIRRDQRILVPDQIYNDINEFISEMRETEIRLKDIGITDNKDDILNVYSLIYIRE